MRERPVPVSAAQPFPADGLLPDGARHLGQVQHGASSTGPGHDHSAVLDPEVLPRDLAGEVSRATEDLHRLDLEGRLERTAGHSSQLSALVRDYAACDRLEP